MHHRNRTLALTTASLSLLTLVAGCGRLGAAPASPTAPIDASSSPTPQSSEMPANPATQEPTDHEHATPEPSPVHPSDVQTDDTADDPDDVRLQQLWLADPPVGSGPQIALRFLRALQDGDDFRAATELFIAGRTGLSYRDRAFLHHVMRDVAGNAKLQEAGRCTAAHRLTTESAVVTCGQQNVVVHVLDSDIASGVQISDAHPVRDHYNAPHTHAFTTLEL
jgi:hypothetical protein